MIRITKTHVIICYPHFNTYTIIIQFIKFYYLLLSLWFSPVDLSITRTSTKGNVKNKEGKERWGERREKSNRK